MLAAEPTGQLPHAVGRLTLLAFNGAPADARQPTLIQLVKMILRRELWWEKYVAVQTDQVFFLSNLLFGLATEA